MHQHREGGTTWQDHRLGVEADGGADPTGATVGWSTTRTGSGMPSAFGPAGPEGGSVAAEIHHGGHEVGIRSGALREVDGSRSGSEVWVDDWSAGHAARTGTAVDGNPFDDGRVGSERTGDVRLWLGDTEVGAARDTAVAVALDPSGLTLEADVGASMTVGGDVVVGADVGIGPDDATVRVEGLGLVIEGSAAMLGDDAQDALDAAGDTAQDALDAAGDTAQDALDAAGQAAQDAADALAGLLPSYDEQEDDDTDDDTDGADPLEWLFGD
jgi:hypothetical protein